MQDPDQQDTIIVLSSVGGGGHVAASEALKEALGQSYQIQVYNAISEVFSHIDLFSKLTKNKFSAEDSYNFFLKKRFFILANLYAIAGKPFMKINQENLMKAAYEFLKAKKPKMVFSVIPFFNGALCEACKKLEIPFWIIPTDVELKTFFIGLKKHHIHQNLVKLALAYAPQIEQAYKWGFKDQNIIEVGFPVKKACVKNYTPEELLELKQTLKVEPHRRVLTLTLGAAGTSMFFNIAKKISRLSFSDLEIMACAGRDKKSWKKLERFLSQTAVCEEVFENCMIFRLSSGSRLHLFGFTSKLPEIMAISDLIIAKTGSLSVSEALHLNKYLLLDNTFNSSSRLLFWERPNLKFVRSINKGEGFSSKRDLMVKLEAFLSASREYSEEVFLNIHQILPEVVRSGVN